MQAGDTLDVTASHDTYSISFALGSVAHQELNGEIAESAQPNAASPVPTGVPLKVKHIAVLYPLQDRFRAANMKKSTTTLHCSDTALFGHLASVYSDHLSCLLWQKRCRKQ